MSLKKRHYAKKAKEKKKSHKNVSSPAILRKRIKKKRETRPPSPSCLVSILFVPARKIIKTPGIVPCMHDVVPDVVPEPEKEMMRWVRRERKKGGEVGVLYNARPDAPSQCRKKQKRNPLPCYAPVNQELS